MRITVEQQFINAVREMIGLGPLYGVEKDNEIRSHGYWRLEALRRLASPECKVCGGCGYADDGERFENPCACTGRVYAKRAKKKRSAHAQAG